jgi:hypothetical protein
MLAGLKALWDEWAEKKIFIYIMNSVSFEFGILREPITKLK